MSNTIERSSVVESAKQNTEMCKGRLAKTFGFVPDDMVNWAPAPTCKSALAIVAHCAIANGNFIGILQGKAFPAGVTMADMLEASKQAEKAITTREQALAKLDESTKAFTDYLDTMTPEQVDSMIETPIMTMPATFFMNLAGRHMDNHAGQIDYIQTCWGDMDWHM